MKAWLRDLLPPALDRAIAKSRRPGTRYSGPYSDWDAAADASRGYADGFILQVVSAATRSVLDGDTRYEQDGVAFSQPPPASPVLSGLLLAACRAGGRLSVLDFGGGLASQFLRWRDVFLALPAVDWQVIEQDAFAIEGSRLFQGRGLPVSFATGVPVDGPAPGAVLIGSSLQYVRDPAATLARLLATGPDLVIFDRTPVHESDRHTVLVQHVPSKVYAASYPMTVLAASSLQSTLSSGYHLLERWPSSDGPIRAGRFEGRFEGSLWIRKEAR